MFMSEILTKKEMSEEDIKFRYITPAITANWDASSILMEAKITDGKINLKGNIVFREKPKKADYLLYLSDNNPIAVVEAKDNNHSVSFGIQQAMTYAQMLDVPFAYSSNGDAFYEHDFLTGDEREIPLEEFPTPAELVARYYSNVNGGVGFSEDELKAMNQPYYTSQTTYPPRYYQQKAVNRTLDAIAKGQDRLLLVMATGTGKTYTAFQIVYRLLKSGMKKKVLYLADRNILVDQSIDQDFAPLKNIIHKINFAKDDATTLSSYEVFFSLYQQLTGESEAADGEDDTMQKFQALFKPDFFDLVIVDECHRGSAKEDSNWRAVLDYFSTATQIGMTATPKETAEISNIDYFGEPVFSYSLKEGIDDGFLAPFKVINVKTNIGEGWRPYKGQLDAAGNEIEDRIYTNNDFDYNIILQDRIDEVAGEITRYLKSFDRMAKTIVFCANERHAEMMRDALVKKNQDLVKKYPDYVVRITGSDPFGKSKLDYFISVSSEVPVIATTSDLLSTGADCKTVKLIVLDQMINSMIRFKQIIGRGTRIREDVGKLSFAVMDFRNVTRLFADPDWDGPIEQDENFTPNPGLPVHPKIHPNPSKSNEKPYITADGCKVVVIGKLVSIYDVDGKLLKQESIVDYTKSNIINDYASLDNFIKNWSAEDKKASIKELLLEKGIDLDAMKADQNMQNVDDFDFICHVAFDKKPLTRRERANNVKKRDFLSRYSGAAREVLDALIDKYMNEGIYEIESTEVLRLDPISQYGSPSKIVKLFGGKDGYISAVKALEAELYAGG